MNKRQIHVYFPALKGPEELLFRRMSGDEGLSRLFQYDVELLSRSPNIDLDKVLGQEMCIGIDLADETQRYFHGYVSSFAQVESDGEFAVYKAILRPHLWRLTRTADCRIFQNPRDKTRVPDIVAQILREHGISHVKTHYNGGNRSPYLPWDYCVQYRETDFNFISRLLEHEGIHYYFKHEADRHTLILTDSLAGHSTVTGYETVQLRRSASDAHQDEGLWSWQTTRSVLPGTYAGCDYDFLNPTTPVLRSSGSAVERKHAKAASPDYEIYDHPEAVVQMNGYKPQDIEDYARMRMEELHAQYEVIRAKSNARGVGPGDLFKVGGNVLEAVGKSEYLVTSADFHLHLDDYRSAGGSDSEPTYECVLQVINSTHHYRPPRTAPKPLIQGPQSATVVGSGPVHTDQYGRVKVQFHWDRVGKNDENSSCWVRVSQGWAGANWGAMFLPHVGQEVLVGFMEGDPDRPIVIGRVYNPRNMPPLTLPDGKLQSIIRDHFGNEIIMDGTPGNEHMSLHSPSHHSVLKIGKSVRQLTFSKSVSSSYDSESYSFGSKLTFTKGHSFSLDRGAWASVKLGVGVSATIGAEATVSAATKLSFVAGGTVALSASWSCAWGWARELKFTRGSYKRASYSDVLLDSHKSVFITGGENDESLVQASEKALTLSYQEDPGGARAAAMKAAETKAAVTAGLATTLIGGVAGLGVWGYERDIADMGPVKHQQGKTDQIDADTDKISKVSWADSAALGALALGVASGVVGFPGQTIDNPKHPSPSSELVFRKNQIEGYAGKEKKTHLDMSETGGFVLTTDKRIQLDAEEGILYKSKKDVKLTAETQVMIEGIIKHKNLTVLK